VSALTTIEAPFDRLLGESPEEFLENLPGSAWLVIPGSGPGRPRALTTLLHGNEPSGFRAVHRWLKNGGRPAVDLHVCLASVEAARTAPFFTWRARRGGRDLNRCFKEPFEGYEGELAGSILERLNDLKPEALIDLHNTSGSGPAFSLASRVDAAHERLSSFFTLRMVRLRTELGTIMEATVASFPTLTVECGGVPDAESEETAFRGFKAFAEAPAPLRPEDTGPVELLESPIQVKLKPGLSLIYGDRSAEGIDLTLREDIDRLNYGVTAAGTEIGWIDRESLDFLDALIPEGSPPLSGMLRVRDGTLETARPLRFLLATTRADIGVSDCLFYLIASL